MSEHTVILVKVTCALINYGIHRRGQFRDPQACSVPLLRSRPDSRIEHCEWVGHPEKRRIRISDGVLKFVFHRKMASQFSVIHYRSLEHQVPRHLDLNPYSGQPSE